MLMQIAIYCPWSSADLTDGIIRAQALDRDISSNLENKTARADDPPFTVSRAAAWLSTEDANDVTAD